MVESFEVLDSKWDDFVSLPDRLPHYDEERRASARQEILESCRGPNLARARTRCFLTNGPASFARTLAIVDQNLLVDGDPAGMIGFFEAGGDRDAGLETLGAAVAWLAKQGVSRVLGPMNFSILGGYRLMTDGFETSAFVGEPRNPPSYPLLFEDMGFEKFSRYRSWDIDRAGLELMHAGAKQRVLPDMLHRIRAFDEAHREKEVAAFHALLLASYRANPAFAPIDLDAFVATNGSRIQVDPQLTPIAVDERGEMIGAGYLYRDRPDRLIMYSMMVHPEHRDSGVVAAGLSWVLRNALELGVKCAVGALAIDGPTIYDRVAKPSRAYHLFQKRL